MTKWYKFKNLVFRLTHPKFWEQVRPNSEVVDDLVNRIIDENLVDEVQYDYIADAGAIKIWIGNYPYCYGYVYGGPINTKNLPYPLTRVRLKKYIEDWMMYKDLENMFKDRNSMKRVI